VTVRTWLRGMVSGGALVMACVVGTALPAGAASKPSAKAACSKALKQAHQLVAQVDRAVEFAQQQQGVVGEYVASSRDAAATTKALNGLSAIVLPNFSLGSDLQQARNVYATAGEQCAKALGLSPKIVAPPTTATTAPAR